MSLPPHRPVFAAGHPIASPFNGERVAFSGVDAPSLNYMPGGAQRSLQTS